MTDNKQDSTLDKQASDSMPKSDSEKKPGPDNLTGAGKRAAAKKTASSGKHSASSTPSKKTGSVSKADDRPEVNKNKIATPVSKTATIALLLSLLVVGAIIFLGNEFRTEQMHIDAMQQRDNDQQTTIDNLSSALSKAETELTRETEARNDLRNNQQALSNRFDDVLSRVGRTSFAWRVAELDYLLTLANHRLQFLGDVQTSIDILENADQRLVQMGDPGLLPVREAVASELLALRQITRLDVSGIAIELGKLADEITRLPLVDSERIASVGEMGQSDVTVDKTWRDIPGIIWDNLKSLVQIRRHSQPMEPLLPASESWYLTQNLRLKLEQARLAALREDGKLFQMSLQEADDWLAVYFDQESAVVKTVRATLAELKQSQLDIELPDISASLRRLREFSRQQQLSSLNTQPSGSESNDQ